MPRWIRIFRAEDLAWILLFAAMAVFGSTHHPFAIILLSCLAALQVIEPKIVSIGTRRGTVISIFVKLALCYLLIGVTPRFGSAINSSYYWILLLPVVSAATSLGLLGTAFFAALSCLSYASFLLFIDWSEQGIPPEEVAELSLRFIFLVLVGFLTYRLADANRKSVLRYQALAKELEAANRSLQEAEAAFRRSERLAALGQLSAGLAHELRNPLGTIKASAEMLVKRVSDEGDVARELAGFISSEVDRTNSLVTRFLDFARPLRLQPKTAELTETIDHAITQLERTTPHYDVTIYRNYSPDIPPFPFDAELIERVIYNLLLNAAQATPPGGAITVKTKQADAMVEVAIIDRGSGIDPKLMENIFNPFFTTKPEGSGLGLAIVSKIVNEHGGRITVESQPGKGSIFRVFLPVSS